MNVDQSTRLVEPGRRIFVAQSEVECNLRRQFPGVVNVVILAERAELCLGQRDRNLATFAVTEQEIGKRISRAGCADIRGGIRFKEKCTARKLVAHLIILIPSQLSSEAQAMTAE